MGKEGQDQQDGYDMKLHERRRTEIAWREIGFPSACLSVCLTCFDGYSFCLSFFCIALACTRPSSHSFSSVDLSLYISACSSCLLFLYSQSIVCYYIVFPLLCFFSASFISVYMTFSLLISYFLLFYLSLFLFVLFSSCPSRFQSGVLSFPCPSLSLLPFSFNLRKEGGRAEIRK